MFQLDFDAHGAKPVEVDANNWALKYCNGRPFSIAKMLVEEQNACGMFVFEAPQTLKKAIEEAVTTYNPIWGKVILMLLK